MPLEIGTQLGPYRIDAPLGAGGMGEVYRARDTKLGRDVAVKILAATFVNDPERAARFEREAQLLAALNHPHIGAIYGLEHANGTQFLVLELVEGQTLAARIAGVKGGSLPVPEALRIARQVIDALEAAHEKGIIHRDLKPANIALTADGEVKVLDFGLAKLDAAESGSVADLSHSPTLTFAATRAGVILGTAAYMSPEQAKGRIADKRSDVWAFGCVLFEMLAGKRAFEGEDASDTLAAVLRGDPDWSALPPDLPPAIGSLLKRCLEKDRRTRIPDISVVRFLLEDSAAGSTIPSGKTAAAASSGGWRGLAPWLGMAALGAGLILVLAYWVPWGSTPPGSSLRVSGEVGADASVANSLGANAVPSPDGNLVAFVAAKTVGEQPQMYIRRLDQLQATAMAGTEGAASPFFAPDGQWIAFFAQGKLKKISVTGGAAVTLCDALNGRGGSWGDDGTIVFQPSSAPGVPLQRVPAAGGKPETAIQLAAGETTHRWPQLLPGAKAVLYTSNSGTGNLENADIVVRPLADGPPKILQRGGYYGRYLRSGHIVYMHQGTVFAAPFDVERLELTGPSVPAVEGVTGTPATGGVQFAASDNGTAVYLPGQSLTNTGPIQWMDRTGKTTPLRTAASDWSGPSFAPDRRRLAIDISDGTQVDVWIYEWERDTLSRLTFDATDDQRPAWSADSRRVAFASKRGGDKSVFNLYWQRADGTGEVQRLTESKNNQYPGSWHPSGRFLAFQELNGQNQYDIMILPLEGDETGGWKPGKPTTFLSTAFGESSPMFSPDGRWIAYLSNESGRIDLYVRPFPGPGGKWQISTGPADDPTWSRTRRELYFASTADLRIMVSPFVIEGDSFRADKPRLWAPGQFVARPRPPSRDLDLHPDGERFAMAAGSGDPVAKQDKVVFIFNFFDELRRIAPAGR